MLSAVVSNAMTKVNGMAAPPGAGINAAGNAIAPPVASAVSVVLACTTVAPEVMVTLILLQKSVADPLGVPFNPLVHAPGARVNDAAAAVPMFLKVTLVVTRLLVPAALVGTIVVLPPYLLMVAQVEALMLMVLGVSVLLHTTGVPPGPVSCRITVPEAAVFVELVIAAVNAEKVLVIDSDSNTAPAIPAISSSGVKRRRFNEATTGWSDKVNTFHTDDNRHRFCPAVSESPDDDQDLFVPH